MRGQRTTVTDQRNLNNMNSCFKHTVKNSLKATEDNYLKQLNSWGRNFRKELKLIKGSERNGAETVDEAVSEL